MGMQFLNGGLLTTLQDFGRIGYQQYGVSVSGVMDQRSAALANVLVGNQSAETLLEITMMGPMITFTESNIIAVTGGDMGATLNDKPIAIYKAVLAKKGDTLKFSMLKSGCRCYLAVAGGFDINPVMNSCSTYIKGQIGGIEGRKITKDDFIAFKAPKLTLPNMAKRSVAVEDFSNTEKTLHVIMGPQEDAFTQKGIDTFLGSTYKVSNQFDRMGCRLDGEIIEHVKDANIISDGIAFGAIQVPGEGKPIIMLADRQTTGGYTKIANVITVDLPIIAQSKAGDTIKFKVITIEEAQQLYVDWLNKLEEIKAKLDQETIVEKPTDFAPVANQWETIPAPLALAAAALSNGNQEFEIEIDGHNYRCKVRLLK